MKSATHHSSLFYYFVVIVLLTVKQPLQAQNYEIKSAAYNVLLGGLSGGIGATINKKHDEKWYKAFEKGFLIGTGGGAIMYGGKKINYLVGKKNELGYAWLSRSVFSAGNSIVENASANIDFWTRWHFDIGFVRFEFKTGPFNLTPRLLPSALGGIIFVAANNGKLNVSETIRSGTLTFTSSSIKYAPQFVASTTGNSIVHVTSLTGPAFYQIYGHEMVHTFQFQEFSGVNYFFMPISNKLKNKSDCYKKLSKWIYLDVNYELMLTNYFLIQGSYKDGYNHNFLENEAEFLSTGHQ
jgi:hypothetical protein